MIDDSILTKRVVLLIDERDFASAINLIHQRLSLGLNASEPGDAILKATLAGFLIDIGEEGGIEKAVLDGLKIYGQDCSSLKRFISEASLQYNIGNGKHSLFKIQRKELGFEFKPSTIELLTEAKNHYWRAFKLLEPEDESIRPQLLVNLANTLSTSGRVVEALQYFDLALQVFPDLPQANSGRSEALLWLNQLSNTYSVNMLRQALTGFDKAAASTKIPTWLGELWASKRDRLKMKIKEFGHSEVDIEHDIATTQKEFESLSSYRKYCVLNHLTLSEHSLYCKCSGARWDDLTIPMSTVPISGSFVPRMEHVLNRLKVEFALARLLFYQVQEDSEEVWKTFDVEVAFTELYEGEIIGLHPEMLRTSFRLCFGILDKIAHALCEMYELAKPEEKIYFESFWRRKDDRWSKINSISSFSLIALYSQATDLNSKTGEWGIYKNWRNSLEHEMFVIEDASVSVGDPYAVFEDRFPIYRVPQHEFKTKTLHLLQLVRSAIFNFVFCVRQEGSKNAGERGGTVILLPKV